MKDQQIFPKNADFFRRLITFGGQVLDACRSEGIEPTVYGSLAYLYATGDSEIEISDIDFLTPESDFKKIANRFTDFNGIRVELTTYHSLKLLKGDLKVSFDSIEHYFNGLRALPSEVAINAIRFTFLDPLSLAEVYRRGAQSIPMKREAYERKLARLTALTEQ